MDTPLNSSGMPRKRPGCKHKHNPLPQIIDHSLNLNWKGVVSKVVKDRGQRSEVRKLRPEARGQRSEVRTQKGRRQNPKD